MKKYIGLFCCVFAVLITITACGSDTRAKDAAQSETQIEKSSNEEGSNILVVYFSATGNTEKIAEMIADELSADLYEIKASDPYTEEDLNYNDDESRATVEQKDDSVRPEIDGSIENWDQYDTVFIGHPIWWGEEPRIMDTFVESYDFDGKTITTFCTSGSSSIGNSGKNLESNAESGTWIDGQRFSANVSETEIASWIKDLGIE